MDKGTAVIDILHDAKARRCTKTGANRVATACATLGLTAAETLRVFGYLDYCNKDGKPWNTDVPQVWPIPTDPASVAAWDKRVTKAQKVR